MAKQLELNGYEIREALSFWKLKNGMALTEFNDSIWSFEDENKRPVEETFADYANAEKAIIEIESLQQLYNTKVTVTASDVDGTEVKMSLSQAIKYINVIGRSKARWQEVLRDRPARGGYFNNTRIRDKEQEEATKQIDNIVAAKYVQRFNAFASRFSAAIAKANAQTVTLTVDDSVAEALNKAKEYIV